MSLEQHILRHAFLKQISFISFVVNSVVKSDHVFCLGRLAEAKDSPTKYQLFDKIASTHNHFHVFLGLSISG